MKDDMDKMIDRQYKRMQTFVNEGLSEYDAFDLAEAMFERDRDIGDDRRVCFECIHLKDHYCHGITDRYGKPTTQMRFVLQRCPSFKLKGKQLTDEERNQIDASNQHQERDE
jgi:hypothetical protein